MGDLTNNQSISSTIEVLNTDICSKCRYVEFTQYPGLEIWAYGIYGINVPVIEPKCRYLHDLFLRDILASKSTPKVEEAKSDP